MPKNKSYLDSEQDIVIDCIMPCSLRVSKVLYIVVLERDGLFDFKSEKIFSAVGWMGCSSKYFRTTNR